MPEQCPGEQTGSVVIVSLLSLLPPQVWLLLLDCLPPTASDEWPVVRVNFPHSEANQSKGLPPSQSLQSTEQTDDHIPQPEVWEEEEVDPFQTHS